MSKFTEFMALVRVAINRDIYMWGGGQPELWSLSQLTEARITAKETSTGNANRVINLWMERRNQYPDAYAADCSGGIIYCMALAGIVSSNFDDTANGLLNRCVKLSNRTELREGDWVGQRSGTNTFHIGIVDRVDPNGQIWIDEWRGRDRGMVCTKIEDGAKPWNRYGRPDWAYIADGQESTPGDIAPAPLPAPDWELTRLLKVTMPYLRGNDVHNAQLALIARGFSCGSTGADGVFGNGTKTVVLAFQRSAGITDDGIIGQTTCETLGGKWNTSVPTFGLSRLLKVKSPLMKGGDIKDVQRGLIRRNYDIGSVKDDGEYGNKTKNAVIAFQKAVGLVADGIVGKNTCEALNGTWEG